MSRVACLTALFLAFSSLATTSELCAQTTYTWSGAVSGEWTALANWNPNGVPGISCHSVGGNAIIICDTAVFGPSARTSVNVTVGYVLSADSLKFLENAPAYALNVTGTLSLANGVDNLSGTTHPTFTVTDRMFVYGGTLANSTVIDASALTLFVPANDVDASVTMLPSASLFAAGYYVGQVSLISLGSLSGAGNVYMASFQLVLGALGRNDVFSGVIADGSGGASGAGGVGASLTKIGRGTLTLSGANTYTGPTSINAGTLQVDGSLSASSAVDVSSDGDSILSGAGRLGNVTVEPGASLRPGNASPGSYLTLNRLSCDPNYGADVLLRLGSDSGGHTHGTQMFTLSPLIQANCARLKVIFSSASVPLVVGTPYLIAAAFSNGTDYTAANLSYDFHAFPGYSQASGHFTFFSINGISQIFFTLDSPGDKIFSNGFE